MDNPETSEGPNQNGQSRDIRRATPEWTIQRHCQHWVNKTQDEDKQNKNTTQKTKKMSNMNPGAREA